MASSKKNQVAKVEAKMCPRPGCENPRHVTKSGNLRGLCAVHEVEASRKSREKNHPNKTSQRNQLIDRLTEVIYALPKGAGKSKQTLIDIVTELNEVK